MSTTKQSILAFVLAGLSGCVPPPCCHAAPPGDGEQVRAAEILAATGVKGGLIVHLGCGDGKLTAALRAGEGYLVHGLEADPGLVEQARRRIRAMGVYGAVSVEQARGGRLPYADNLVKLAVVEDPRIAAREEIMRVLAPLGVAYFRNAEQWEQIVKPWPAEIDEWSHALHDASNNAVARDRVVGPPQHVQWVAGPRNARHHEHIASVSVLVSSAGRLFSVVDEAPAASVLLPAQWSLVARDAFSGVLLWRRPVAAWESHLRAGQAGPVQLSRRLVASAQRVYVAPESEAPLAALDAASGETVRTYEGTKRTEEVLYHEGTLYVLIGASPKKAILALDAATGRVRWRKDGVRPAPVSLAVGSGRAVFLDEDAVVCLDAADGRELWRAPRTVAQDRPPWSAPTVVVHGDVVLCADRDPVVTSNLDEATGKRVPQWMADGAAGGKLVAYSAKDGRELWSCVCGEAYHSPADVFVSDGLVWVGQTRARFGPDFTAARDLLTGQIKRRIAPEAAFQTTMPHHRCHRNRATSRYLVTGRTGVEFIDQQTGEALRHHWIRGGCQYGTLPANGLLYLPPHSCACYIESKLAGFYALAPEQKARNRQATGDDRLERGPAYGQITGDTVASGQDWPTYRHDAARSGRTKSTVPGRLARVWEASVGGRLTSPVVAEGLALVASVDAHTLCAFDAARGTAVWESTAGGRIDSPPTVARGLAVFGSADGYVYCLRARDGRLAWRFRAAPHQRRIVAFDRLESAWPVHGSVLVAGDVVYCAAGRSSYLDGGIFLYRLDLASGKMLSQERLWSRDQKTDAQPGEPRIFEMPGAQPDVLSLDGRLVYMRHLAFDPAGLAPQKPLAHLYSPAGFLDGDWWHRTYWIFGEHFYSGYLGWYFAGREAPAGRLLAVDGPAIYGFAYKPEFYSTTTKHAYHLFAVEGRGQPAPVSPDSARDGRSYNQLSRSKFKVAFRWQRDVPLLARAMLLAGDTLVIAGPPEDAIRSPEAFFGKKGAILSAISSKDGATRQECRLESPPVFDGMAAAEGRVYVAMENGRLVCLGDGRSGRE